jgi:hypothetical protein
MPTGRPTFTLTIGGLRSTTAEPVGGPTRFVVDRDMDVAADSLRVLLADRAGVALGDQVDLALGDDGDDSDVFTGTVAVLRPAVAAVEVLALGTIGTLLSLRTAGTYEGQTAGAVARDLAGQAGLSAGTVDDGPLLPRFAVDARLSAYAHLRDLADRLGFELYADVQGSLMFHALGGATGLDSVGGGLLGAVGAVAGAVGLPTGGERYEFGRHLLAVTGNRRPIAWGTVDVGGESPMSGRGDRTSHWLTVNDADYRGSAGSGDPRRTLLDPAARTKDLADRFAAGRLAVAQRGAQEVRLSILGRPGVDLGSEAGAAEAPDQLAGGDGYVRAVRHRFGSGTGFVTDLRVSLGAGS